MEYNVVKNHWRLVLCKQTYGSVWQHIGVIGTLQVPYTRSVRPSPRTVPRGTGCLPENCYSEIFSLNLSWLRHSKNIFGAQFGERSCIWEESTRDASRASRLSTIEEVQCYRPGLKHPLYSKTVRPTVPCDPFSEGQAVYLDIVRALEVYGFSPAHVPALRTTHNLPGLHQPNPPWLGPGLWISVFFPGYKFALDSEKETAKRLICSVSSGAFWLLWWLT